jgi:hypothetical protein
MIFVIASIFYFYYFYFFCCLRFLSQGTFTAMHPLIRPSCSAPCVSHAGGLIGMLSLNGIFLLVTQHGLEYPRFYERLYCLLSAEAFKVCGRAAGVCRGGGACVCGVWAGVCVCACV